MRLSDRRLFDQVDRNLDATAANVRMRRHLMLVWIAFVVTLALLLGTLVWVIVQRSC
jgi:hypothetical protein